MENNFDFSIWSPHQESFIADYCHQSYWSRESFLNPEQTQLLLQESLKLEERDALEPASIGKGLGKERNTTIRTDEIYWIDTFQTEATQLVYQIYEGLRLLAKKELYLPLRRFECHFSQYKPGGYYRKHRDRHQVMPSRLLSCVVYLSDMKRVEGGELVLYPEGAEPIVIQPTPGRIIVFDSELEHEVMPCTVHRRSLTGWLRSDLHPGLNI